MSWWEAGPKNMTVHEPDKHVSKVLDKNGVPYTEKKQPVGFDLTKKEKPND